MMRRTRWRRWVTWLGIGNETVPGRKIGCDGVWLFLAGRRRRGGAAWTGDVLCTPYRRWSCCGAAVWSSGRLSLALRRFVGLQVQLRQRWLVDV